MTLSKTNVTFTYTILTFKLLIIHLGKLTELKRFSLFPMIVTHSHEISYFLIMYIPIKSIACGKKLARSWLQWSVMGICMYLKLPHSSNTFGRFWVTFMMYCYNKIVSNQYLSNLYSLQCTNIQRIEPWKNKNNGILQ